VAAEDCVKATESRIDDYEQTVLAIGAFAHALRWDMATSANRPDSWFLPGRRMDTSPQNRVTPGNVVTPDVVVQLTPDYGVVGEAKASMPKDRQFWLHTLKQLEKYDDNLVGWKTTSGHVSTIDVVLLTHHASKVDIADFLQIKIAGDEIAFNGNISVVAYARITDARSYFSLERSWGRLSDDHLDERDPALTLWGRQSYLRPPFRRLVC